MDLSWPMGEQESHQMTTLHLKITIHNSDFSGTFAEIYEEIDDIEMVLDIIDDIDAKPYYYHGGGTSSSLRFSYTRDGWILEMHYYLENDNIAYPAKGMIGQHSHSRLDENLHEIRKAINTGEWKQ